MIQASTFLMQQDQTPRDCIGCRITGTLAGVGGGLYLAHHAARYRSIAMLMLSGVAISAGVYRGFIWKPYAQNTKFNIPTS
jgi:hypothetical protein